MKKSIGSFFLLSIIVIAMNACYTMRQSKGGGQIDNIPARRINAADIIMLPGYTIEAITEGLTFPTSVTFDDNGTVYVIEAGYAYGEVWVEPKLLKIKNGEKSVIAKGGKNGPWTSVKFYNGNFFVSEGGALDGGKILRISPEGKITTLVEGLPSVGDHHTNNLVIKDEYIYFGQGVATNSAVVGPDNKEFGWLSRRKEFHDIPCDDIVLTGENYESENVLTEVTGDKVLTGAFSPFGTKTSAGQIIKGQVPCTGAILRVPVDGGNVEAYAWGLRNPFGVAISPNGKIYTTENAYDDRGSRPVWGAGDVLWEVKESMWYGWPDFSEGKPIKSDEEFKAPTESMVKPLLQKYPNDPPDPVAILGVHSSSCGFDFSSNAEFGFEGEAFIAQFGDMAPKVGKVLAPVGFKVVRVDINTGIIRDFAVNKGKRNGPASMLRTGGLERPVSVVTSPDGNALYVVDFGILKMTDQGPEPQQHTGVIWKITRK